MAKANENMHGISMQNQEVEEVAEVWRQNFGKKDDIA